MFFIAGMNSQDNFFFVHILYSFHEVSFKLIAYYWPYVSGISQTLDGNGPQLTSMIQD